MGTIFLFIFFGTLLGILLCIVFWTILNGISPMPTSPKVKKQLFQILPKGIQGKIVDLGAGWGTLTFPLAEFYPDQQVIGYESSPIPFVYTKLAQQMARISNLKIVYADFFKINLGEAGLVVCYLYPGAMKKLKDKFEAELKPGTVVISHTFAVPDWSPKQVIHTDDLYKTPIYIYLMDGHSGRADGQDALILPKT